MQKIILLFSILLLTGCNNNSDQRAKPQPKAEEVAVAHILVTHSKSETTFTPSSRTRAEAKNLSLQLATVCNLEGRDFGGLAKKYSDDQSSKNSGGYLGIFRRHEMLLPFEIETFNMNIGSVKGGIETELGYHVIKRLPVHRAKTSHILISWKEAKSASIGTRRNRSQALLLIQELSAQLNSDPDKFCDIATMYSDDPGTRFECGNIGIVVPGVLHKAVEGVLFKMSPGEISDVIETDFGYHIIRRDS
jgi:parvulin-like peptidyl-prolyl isomerase